MKAEDILALRLALGWDTRRCAAYLGVSKATWRNWEAGTRAPSHANLEALLRLKRLADSAEGRASLASWASDADRRRAKRHNRSAP
jgi:transcriptional regulator with XRE-family HTH domain